MSKEDELNDTGFFYWLYQKSFLSGPLHGLKRLCIWIKYKVMMLSECINTITRRIGIVEKNYLPIKGYKGKYAGKRVFITCTGPSLTIEDLEKLEGEYAFGMNSICLIHDKTDWKPDFWGCQDEHVFEKIKDTLLTTDNGQVFLPYSYKKKYRTPSNYVYFHISGAYHLYEMIYGPRYFAKFSDDSFITVYDGYSITYSIIQLAIYMGFDEIYLLGADCSYLGKQHHFIETGHYDPGYQEAAKRMLASYEMAKKYADTHGIKIYNATRGGCLELFPRVNLEDVLAKREKNKSC